MKCYVMGDLVRSLRRISDDVFERTRRFNYSEFFMIENSVRLLRATNAALTELKDGTTHFFKARPPTQGHQTVLSSYHALILTIYYTHLILYIIFFNAQSILDEKQK